MITKTKKLRFTKSFMVKSITALTTAFVFLMMVPLSASAHCDTMDGPTVADAKKAVETNNVNYVLKWIQPEYENEITDKFNLSMKVKDLSPEAKEISEQYFFGELVRLHRAGEGAPFDGLKPTGTPIDERVLAADISLETGDLSPLKDLIDNEMIPELEERFDKAMALKDFDVNDVEAGREYIEAYVSFFKFAEGEEDEHGAEAHGSTNHKEEEQEVDSHDAEEVEKEVDSHDAKEDKVPVNWLPWSLAGLFFVTTVIAHIKHGHIRNHKEGGHNCK